MVRASRPHGVDMLYPDRPGDGSVVPLGASPFKATFQSSMKGSSGGPHFSPFLSNGVENQLSRDGSASSPCLVVVQVVLLLD